ncbi:hypothetical protein V1512DRAFT_263244 [Lipomyces arxii]|uniref:uncharacterized protein n=1 Tax=Lipomyces arxii TaxID=56418 RepID=UPI0034CDA57E
MTNQQTASVNITAQQLLDTFSNPSLTPTAYLNSILPSYKPSNTTVSQLHTEVVSIFSSLDHATQDLIAKLERVVTEMLSSAQRLKYEVELLASDVEQLDSTMQTDLKPRVDNDIALKSPAMQRLEKLDLVRRNLIRVLDTFAEAKKIDADIRVGGSGKLEDSIHNLLAEGKFKLASDEVERLSKVMEVWKGTKEYQAKTEFASRLRKLVQDTITRSESTASDSASIRTESVASTPAAGRSPAPPSNAFDRQQDYPNVRASADFLRHEAREGYLGLIESLKKIRQA